MNLCEFLAVGHIRNFSFAFLSTVLSDLPMVQWWCVTFKLLGKISISCQNLSPYRFLDLPQVQEKSLDGISMFHVIEKT